MSRVKAVTESAATKSKAYIFEIDLVRAYTAFTVVAIHAMLSTSSLVTGTISIELFSLIAHLLHYNREVFVFITGLVLTYIYFENKQFSVKKLYLNRFYIIFIPYVVWSIVYVIINNRFTSPLQYMWPIAYNILTGNASPQMYYIVLTLQLCAVFPLFLLFIKKVKNHPWTVIAIALALQLVMAELDFHYLQNGSLRLYGLTNYFLTYQDRVIPAYQLFLVLGGLSAVYITQIREFLIKYGKFIPLFIAGTIAVYASYYYVELYAFHETIGQATSTMQPSVVLYSMASLVSFGWLSMLWAKKRLFHRFIKFIAEASFGIFFVHFIFLGLITNIILPALPFAMPMVVTVVLVIALTFGLSALFCYVLLKIPFLTWTIGRKPRASGQWTLQRLMLRLRTEDLKTEDVN